MKRIVITALLGLLLLPNLLAQNPKNLNNEQLAMRSDLFNFVKQEGYMPELDSDGDIKFKSEGKTFYISISANDESPMYITLFREFAYPEKYSKRTVVLASEELNLYKGVKIIFFKEYYRVCAELYVRDAEPLKGCFYKLINNIDSLVGDILEECAKVNDTGSAVGQGGAPFTVNSIDVANVDKDNNIINSWGNTIYSSQTKYLKPRINITSNESSGKYYVYVKLFKDNVLQRNSNTSPEGYTYSDDITLNGTGNQTINLVGWGSNTSGNWSAGSYRFEVWFKGQLLGSKLFYVK